MTRLTPIVLTALTLALAAGTAHAADAAKAVTPPKPEAKADAALAKVIQESFVSKGPATVEAVSYTHLTLPTTCTPCRSRWSPYH